MVRFSSLKKFRLIKIVDEFIDNLLFFESIQWYQVFSIFDIVTLLCWVLSERWKFIYFFPDKLESLNCVLLSLVDFWEKK